MTSPGSTFACPQKQSNPAEWKLRIFLLDYKAFRVESSVKNINSIVWLKEKVRKVSKVEFIIDSAQYLLKMLWTDYIFATFSLSYENYQQWKKESCQGIGSWTEVRYCAELMINSTLLTLHLLNSLSTIHLNWYFLRMTQPWMLYSQIKNSYFSFGWIWLLLGRQRSIGDVIWSFGG